MKSLLLLFALTGTAVVHAVDPRNTSVTPEELLGYGDFDADGDLDTLLIDRPTGLLRAGLTQPDGSLAWQPARPTGCPGAEAMAVGSVRAPGTLDLVVTGPAANQIFLLNPLATFSRPQGVVPSGIGPVSVAAVDLALPGNDATRLDLAALSAWNSEPDPRSQHLLQSLAGGISTGSDTVLAAARRRGSRVILRTGDPELYADLESGATDTFRVVNTQNPALPLKTSVSGLPAGADFVHARLFSLPRYQFVFFNPGTTGLLLSDTVASSGNLVAPVAKTIGTDPVRSVHVIHDGTRPCLAVIYNDGSHGEIYHFDAAGDPVLDLVFTPSPGESLKGVLGYAASNFELLSGPPAGGSTTRVRYDRGSGTWQRGTESTLPPLGSATASANVFLYQTEPLVDPAAKLIETIQVPDWTSGLLIDGAGNVTVTAEAFDGESDGLRSPAASALGTKPAGAAFGLANQYRPEVSVTTGQQNLGVVPLQIGIDPPPGSYSTYITPRLTVPVAAGIDAYYRFGNAGAWTSFDLVNGRITPPQDTLAGFTVNYYAHESSTGRRSPVYSAAYTFSGEPGSLDSDGDGVPDFVELAKGLDPLAGADSDEDGMSDLEELLFGSDPANGSETAAYGANTLNLPPSRTNDTDGDGFSDFTEWASGSDPFDAGSLPATGDLVEYRNVIDLNLRPLSQSGIAGMEPNRESYKEGHATFSATTIRVHDAGGRLLQTAPTDFHGAGAPLPNPFARLEALPAGGRDLFFAITTPPTFDMVQDAGLPGWGRELVALVPVPSIQVPPLDYTYAGGSSSTAATAWIAALQAHYDAQPRQVISSNFDLYDSLALLAFERLADIKLRARGTLAGGPPLSLTPFRDTDPATYQVASQDTLLSLQGYVSAGDSGWKLQSVHAQLRNLIRNSPNPRMAALRKLGLEIHRISAALTDASPGLYPSPFETLREAIRAMPAIQAEADGLIPLPGDPVTPAAATSYAAAHTLTSPELQSADEAIAWLLGQITPRPVESLTASITAASFDGTVPVILNEATSALLRLYDADGNPFRFPEALDLPVGTLLSVTVFTDRTDLPAGTGTARETVDATVLSFPSGTRDDADQNAIEDAYENYFFGGPVDPFGDADGDGFINLQEFLDGTRPDDGTSVPAGPPLPNRIPPVRIIRTGSDLRFELDFPSIYASRIQFLLQSGNLTAPFVESPGSEAVSNELNTYVLQIPMPGATRRFYRFRLALRP